MPLELGFPNFVASVALVKANNPKLNPVHQENPDNPVSKTIIPATTNNLRICQG